MATDQQRRERVTAGSRRKRDLAAVAPRFNCESFATQHFPDAPLGSAIAATFHVWARHHKRRDPEVAEVREELVRRMGGAG